MNDLTLEEQGIIAITRLNKAEKKTVHKWEFTIGKFEIHYKRRSKSCLWGRFGGGWNWKVGIQAGGDSVIFEMLVATLRIDKRTA